MDQAGKQSGGTSWTSSKAMPPLPIMAILRAARNLSFNTLMLCKSRSPTMSGWLAMSLGLTPVAMQRRSKLIT